MAELRTLETRPAQIRQEVVDLLEQTLAEARRGEIASVAIAGVLADGATVRTRHSRSEHGPALLGATQVVGYRLLVEMEAD